ncbi:MAG TPA: hypothetical protein VF821_34380 [Lentzea sp.]
MTSPAVIWVTWHRGVNVGCYRWFGSGHNRAEWIYRQGARTVLGGRSPAQW